MSKLLPISASFALVIALAACVDVGDIPSLGGETAYQRSIDQDTSTLFSGGPTTRNLSPPSFTPGNWR